MSTQEFDAAIEVYRQALRSMMHGEHKPVLNLYSRGDDVTLANPLGPPIRGWANIEKEAASVAAGFAGGDMTFDEVTRFAAADLGYVVAIERAQVHRKGSDQAVPMALRVTTVLRREEGRWMIALRHADRVTERTPPA